MSGSSSDILLNSSGYGVSVFRPRYNRAWVDLSCDPEIFKSKGQIRCKAIPVALAFEKKVNKKLSLAACKLRLQKYYWPYYADIENRIKELKEMHGHVLLLDVTMFRKTSKMKADIFVSSSEESIDKIFYSIAISQLSSLCNLRVEEVKIKFGGHFNSYFGNPKAGIHVLQIAVEEKIFEDKKYVNNFYENLIQRTFREFAFLSKGFLKVKNK